MELKSRPIMAPHSRYWLSDAQAQEGQGGDLQHGRGDAERAGHDERGDRSWG